MLMQVAGLVALLVGFLGGALVSILEADAIVWSSYTVCFVVAALGVALLRLADRQQASNREALAAKMSEVRSSIEILTAEAQTLADSFREEEVYGLPTTIDERFPEPFARFMAAREAIAEVYGTRAYADIMGEIAAGERYLNRVWSAAAEGYVDEARIYIDRARRQIQRTRDAVNLLKAP